ncbi:MAG: CRISPR system precrRNA processing endoribonuclease RAMP protein Cas6 [Planctomycetes bacterium]|nr:CRISPR system precrRNA processing endoribonuclease RAMP protein Cas6 [Planctomycetota bacterium]
MPFSFRLAKFRFTVCAKDHIRFPAYKGAVFRGGFGYAFKKVVCVVRGKPCDTCMLKQKCIYAYIFETPPPEDAEILRLYPKVPHPFVIEPPADEKLLYSPGESFSFSLILIGRAIEYLPYFIYTFTELGKQGIGQGRGKYDLLQVEGISLGNEAIQVYDNKTQTLANHYPIITQQGCNRKDFNHEAHEGHEEKTCGGKGTTNGIHSSAAISALYEGEDKGGVKNMLQKDTPQGNNPDNKITISLVTPLRLRFDGHITDKIEFHILVRNLLRRISSLSYFHCDERFQADFKGLIEKAKLVKQTESDIKWYDWNRYSTRQEQWMSLGGVTGAVTYEGDISDFITLLRLGEYVHVGKGTSFGLGKYEIL